MTTSHQPGLAAARRGLTAAQRRDERVLPHRLLVGYLAALGVQVRGFVVSDPRGATVIIGTGPTQVPACIEGTPFPDRPGFVTGRCGHPVPEEEWAAGYRFCAGCHDRDQAQGEAG
jgi:hypothetical protein